MPGTSTEQVVDKGIRQKSIHSFHSIHSFPDSSAFLSGGTEGVFPRTPRNTSVYTRHPTFVTATSGVLTRLPAWLSKNRMRVYTLSDMRSKKKNSCIHGLRSEGVKITKKQYWPVKDSAVLIKNSENLYTVFNLKLISNLYTVFQPWFPIKNVPNILIFEYCDILRALYSRIVALPLLEWNSRPGISGKWSPSKHYVKL